MSSSTTSKLTSNACSLMVLLPKRFSTILDEKIRSLKDRSFSHWPPHFSIVWPFSVQWSSKCSQLAETIEKFDQFEINLCRLEFFDRAHKKSDQSRVYCVLVPETQAQCEKLHELHENCIQLFEECALQYNNKKEEQENSSNQTKKTKKDDDSFLSSLKPSPARIFSPHVTIAQIPRNKIELFREKVEPFIDSLKEKGLTKFTVDAVHVLQRNQENRGHVVFSAFF
mmetsp:Transcript_16843/g.25164  ORF Transcript_16843/g.25164 Transcript_16843/m.25164 type:complete len:226 (+) Transcript_16843:33-710(+)